MSLTSSLTASCSPPPQKLENNNKNNRNNRNNRNEDDDADDDNETEDGASSMHDMFRNRALLTSSILFLALAIRSALSLHPYSGENTPPMYGDFEAQRHWMEIALNLPATDWYKHTSDNDLTYWGLDYPPLSAYLSYICGLYMRWIDNASMVLHSSRGYETGITRWTMRNTVLICDACLLLPAILLVIRGIIGRREGSGIGRDDEHTKIEILWFVSCLPVLVCMDHAHFQYNGVSTALFFFCLFALHRQYDSVASVVFSMCVLFKQTNMYYALPIATCLLSRFVYYSISAMGFHNMLPTPTRNRTTKKSAILYAIRITLSVVITIVILFFPWVSSFSISEVMTVIRRLFPVERGLYEDKVSNIWCTLSIVLPHGFRPKHLLTRQQLIWLCGTITTILSLPFCAMIAKDPWHTKKLVMGCSGCALAAFLTAFHVHEKQIILAMMPLALLLLSSPSSSLHSDDWNKVIWNLCYTAGLSVFPLLNREKSRMGYLCVTVLHSCVGWILSFTEDRKGGIRRERMMVMRLVVVCWSLTNLALHGVIVLLKAPERFPDLLVVMVTTFCCAQFCVVYLLLVWNTLHL